jgi:FdhD protein
MPSHRLGHLELQIARVTGECVSAASDALAIEEPLEIRLTATAGGRAVRRSIAVTMRTPGQDVELAAGFLFTEGIIRHENEITEIDPTAPNLIHVTLQPHVQVDPALYDRHSFVSSSCGVCGKRSIAAVFALRRHSIRIAEPQVGSEVIHALPSALRAAQSTFDQTGGLHAAALFDPEGNLLSLYEDVGRHNALDKLIGAELLAGQLPLGNRLVLVSGRASFELIQKASMAGAPVLAAVGAPSSLAVELARKSRMTLVGFVRDNRYNIYADSGRMTDAAPGLCLTDQPASALQQVTSRCSGRCLERWPP